MTAVSRLARGLVASNVYVSAGSKQSHVPILLNLLELAQRGPTAVVHAYADGIYNRSSFHLVGEAGQVVETATDLALMAIDALRKDTSDLTTASPHPTVGIVDHIAVMPLFGRDSSVATDPFEPNTPSGWAARKIGTGLAKLVDVLYYGSAHPTSKSLADVRREQTSFFQSTLSHQAPMRQVTTVGAPLGFVENYNIRLRCPQSVARSLTRRVRERDGGLAGVEALTLAYGDCFEVACNLLQPDLASAEDIQKVVEQWATENRDAEVVDTYRVGTTSEQCQRVIELDDRSSHDQGIQELFKTYLSATNRSY